MKRLPDYDLPSIDQATELRRMVLRAQRESMIDNTVVPRLIVFCGGKTEVGVTTCVVNLSVVWALEGRRVALIDSNRYRAHVAPMCGVDADSGIEDVLAARRDIHEVLARGPADLRILAGFAKSGQPTDYSPASQQRLLRQIRGLGTQADIVVIDAGCGANDVMRRFWQAADDIVVITSPDDSAITETYTTIKALHEDRGDALLHAIVNRAGDVVAGADALARLARSSARFLRLPIHQAGVLANEPRLQDTIDLGRPLVIEAPQAAFATNIYRMAAPIYSRNFRSAFDGRRQATQTTKLENSPQLPKAALPIT